MEQMRPQTEPHVFVKYISIHELNLVAEGELQSLQDLQQMWSNSAH